MFAIYLQFKYFALLYICILFGKVVNFLVLCFKFTVIHTFYTSAFESNIRWMFLRIVFT